MNPFNAGRSPSPLGQVPLPASPPFQSAQRSLAARALPGPSWAWAGLACLAAGALAFLVTRDAAAPANGKHALRAELGAAEASTQVASPAGPAPGADGAEQEGASGASAPAALGTGAAANEVADEGAGAPPAVKPADEPAQAVASAPRRTKKKARRPSRKRPPRAD